ncbi:hypothetical protein V8D89_011101 [Ganoderma adspersum]
MVGQSKTDDSQASQLLAAALRPRDVLPGAPLLEESHVQESPLLSDSNASVHYHIHGLAPTQSAYNSQDQLYTERSQKENTPASCDKDKSSQPLPPSPPASPSRPQSAPSYTSELKETPSNIFPVSKAAKEKPCPKDFVPLSDSSSPTKPGKAVSLPSPSRLSSRPQPHLDRSSTLPSRAMPPPPRPRSSSPPSQDSFAGPLPQPDPVKAFIASARNFNIPLSQVGEVSQSPSEEDGPPPVSSGIWSYGERDSILRQPSPPPRILVAGTPSDSSHGSNSQYQSQGNLSQSQQLESHYGDSQYSDPFPQAQTADYLDGSSPPHEEGLGTASRSGSSPSSSYERLLADPFEDMPVATQIGDDLTPPTQIVEQTQMDSQVGDVDSVMREHHYYNENSQMIFPTVPSEVRSTHASHSTVPRRLLGMIAPEKRHRYAGLASEAAGPSKSRANPRTTDWNAEFATDTQGSDAPSSDGIHTQDTQATDVQDDAGETQPSDVAVNGSILSLVPRRRLPPANLVLQSVQSSSFRAGPAAAKVPEPEISLDPDETGPTQIVSPSPDRTGPTQVVSPSPDRTGPTQLVSPSPAETGPTEIASPASDRTGPTQLLSPSPEKTGPTQIVSPSPTPARRGRTQMISRSPAKSSPTKVVPDSDPPEPAPVAPLSRRRGPSVSSASTYHSPEVNSRVRAFMQSEDEVLKTIAATEPSVPTIDEEEEEEEEEEEIPLAQKVPSAKARGKQKATEPNVKSPAARNTIARGNANNKSWRGGVIPSSDPGERREEAAPKAAAAVTKNTKPRTPMNQVPPPPPMSRSTRAAKTAARGRLAESSDEDEREDDLSSLTDVATVPAEDDEDEMEVDVPDPKPKPARGNKRKRTVSSSTKKATNGRALVKEESSTPLGRPTKRIKMEGGGMGGGDTATRVFALWKNTAQYYTGTVHQSMGHGAGRYIVWFDDDDSAELELKHLRVCRPKPGDHVLLRQKEKAVVVECPPCPQAGYGPDDTITIALKDDEQEEVEVQCLQIPTRTINVEWDDRVLAEDEIVPTVRPNVGAATPGRRSVSASGQSDLARKRALAGIGLVVSLAPSKEAQNTRDAMVGDIKKCGGVVLDDWTTIFGMEGALEHKNQRWMLRQGDIQWRKKAGHGIDKVFLISDDFHQKSKYLVALALGVPCLSVDWLRAFVEQEAEWKAFLLPAGYSEQLEARVSQMVDIDWGTSDHHLTDVAANKVASKVFAEMTILCISADFVPSKKSKKSGDSALKKEAAESVPRIVLCMGAATVESVAELKHASQDPKDYDYIVVPDQNLGKFSKHENAVDVKWVKDCLISGRLLPLPG